MKTLTQSIKNCINIINFIYEELDDNLLYLVDMWLEHHEEEMQEFIELISKCKSDHVININKLKDYVNSTKYFKQNIKEFVNFIDNDINADTKKDYYNKLKSILEQIISNKSKQNKYNK